MTFRPCFNIIEGDICALDDEICEQKCPLFESLVEHEKWQTEESYRFWDHQIAQALANQRGLS